MKIQCSCGTKLEFEPTPELAAGTARFVCPACGLDSSDFVAQLARDALALPAPPPPPEPPPAGPAVRMTGTPPRAAAIPSPPAPAPARPLCPRHPGQPADETCRVCGKPICQQCLRLFGYVCSPLCKAKAEATGLKLPACPTLGSRVQKRRWRKIALFGWALGLLVAAGCGFWVWYAWIGSRLSLVLDLPFTTPAYAGQSALVGDDDLVFLRGGLLARHHVGAKTAVWSVALLDTAAIEDEAKRQRETMQAAAQRAMMDDPDHPIRVPSPDRVKDLLERAAAAALELRVAGHNIWILSPGKLTRYDWETGKPAVEVPAPGGLIPSGDDLLACAEPSPGQPVITRINLLTGASAVEPVRAGSNSVAKPASVLPGRDPSRSDPTRLARQAASLSLPGRIALPVLLANQRYQEAAMDEMAATPAPKKSGGAAAAPVSFTSSLAPAGRGLVRFSVRLLEHKSVTRSGMKPAAAKSTLDTSLAAARRGDAANEILNDMQRSRGGDVIEEDQSRYEVRLEPAGGGAGWVGEVSGPPALFPLASVLVVGAGKTLAVLDTRCQRRWEATLNYALSPGADAWGDASSVIGHGPCVEYRDGLYVFDQGVLTAFDLASGTVRWSLPSVGVAGLFFDDQGMLYVNTTTAGLDTLRYSRQIDISSGPGNVVYRMDARTGRILWTAHPGGLVRYVAGSYIYTVESFHPEEEDPDGPPPVLTGLEPGPHFVIRRLDPATGRQLWEHQEDKTLVDVRFDRNQIHAVTKKEVFLWKFFSL